MLSRVVGLALQKQGVSIIRPLITSFPNLQGLQAPTILQAKRSISTEDENDLITHGDNKVTPRPQGVRPVEHDANWLRRNIRSAQEGNEDKLRDEHDRKHQQKEYEVIGGDKWYRGPDSVTRQRRSPNPDERRWDREEDSNDPKGNWIIEREQRENRDYREWRDAPDNSGSSREQRSYQDQRDTRSYRDDRDLRDRNAQSGNEGSSRDSRNPRGYGERTQGRSDSSWDRDSIGYGSNRGILRGWDHGPDRAGDYAGKKYDAESDANDKGSKRRHSQWSEDEYDRNRSGIIPTTKPRASNRSEDREESFVERSRDRASTRRSDSSNSDGRKW